MTILTLEFDDSTGRIRSRQPGASLPFTDKTFTVGAGGQTDFALDVDIIAPTVIDVSVNDRRNYETLHWTRDIVLDEVQFISTLPEGTFVHIRAWTT